MSNIPQTQSEFSESDNELIASILHKYKREIKPSLDQLDGLSVSGLENLREQWQREQFITKKQLIQLHKLYDPTNPEREEELQRYAFYLQALISGVKDIDNKLSEFNTQSKKDKNVAENKPIYMLKLETSNKALYERVYACLRQISETLPKNEYTISIRANDK